MAQFATHLFVGLVVLTVVGLGGCDAAHQNNDTQLINLRHSAVQGQFSVDGNYVVLHNPGDKLAVFDVATQTRLFERVDPITQPVNAKGKILAFSLSEDNRLLAIGYRTSVELWDVEQGKQLGTVTVHPTSELAKISVMRLYNRPHLLLVGLNDGTVNVLDLDNQLVKKARYHDSKVVHIAMSAQGQSVLSAGHDGQILLYDAHTLATKRRFTFDRRITSVVQSPDEARLFASDALNEQRIFSIYSDAEYDVNLRYPERFRWFRAAAFSADQRYLATGSTKAWWTLWDTQNGQEIGAYYIKAQSRDATILDMYTNSQGELRTLSSDGFIEFWQISTLLQRD
ncbi:WD40 repeat domain-containing protein [Pseudoalteromonas sp. OOF1S-7]|uniref:WD40 repeat domain-containing protein n=1 Tax=Pseudoalteromonas sp. OOF1S-7 TaxID=2917757 RepID=UPI001EF5285A|nr:WD40 repeat domain-containing protein [Pseudoalteromonas sp. OOF1S-7]MCG7534080.1 WD40 repeat domain-containing protein [Pseudoalteromonas sp. OOF1S-7]